MLNINIVVYKKRYQFFGFKWLLFAFKLIWLLNPVAAYSADNVSFELDPLPGQGFRYINGEQIIVSGQVTSSVILRPLKHNRKNEISFYIVALNRGQSTFDFSTSDISIEATTENNRNVSRIAVLPFEEVEARDRRKAKAENFFAGMAAAGRSLQGIDAGTTRTTGSFVANSQSTIGAQPFSSNTVGAISVTTNDPLKGVIAQSLIDKQNLAEREKLETRQFERSQQLNKYLKRQTVDPGLFHGGVIFIKFDKLEARRANKKPIQVSVRTGSELHKFHLKIF